MKNVPRVTIGVPTYNRLSYVRCAVKSALRQSYPNIQVVVSDNCSQVGTAEYLESIQDERILFVRQSRNLGMVGNWDACLQRAGGEFFLLLSDDDYLEERAIEKLVAAFVNSADIDRVGFAYCRIWEVNDRGERLRITPKAVPMEKASDFALQFFLRNRVLHPCSVLLRTEDLRQIGGYSHSSLVLAADAMAWSKVLQKRGLAVGLDEPLANYRIHASNTTSSHRVQIWQGEIRKLADAWLDAFEDGPKDMLRSLHYATRNYEAWVIAAIINQAAGCLEERFRAIRNYYRCRGSFVGASGKLNAVLGIMKLLVPEVFKRPMRKFLLSRAMPPAAMPMAR